MLLGAGGLALLLTILLIAFGGRKSATKPGEGAIVGQAAGVPDVSALVGTMPSAAAPQETAPPSARDDVSVRSAGSATTTAPAPLPQPRRKGKAVKAAGSKRDYGI